MKKIIIMLTILVAGMVQAQEFDFECTQTILINGYEYSDFIEPSDSDQVRFETDNAACFPHGRWGYFGGGSIRINRSTILPSQPFVMKFFDGTYEIFHAGNAGCTNHTGTVVVARMETTTKGTIPFGSNVDRDFPMDGGDIQQQKVRVWNMVPDFIREFDLPEGWEVDFSTVTSGKTLDWFRATIRKTGCTETIKFHREHVNDTDTYNGEATIEDAIAALTSCN